MIKRLMDVETAVVEGNHGDYTVAVEVKEDKLWSACSCYIGKQGGCHHCVALGKTFLADPESFVAIEKVARTAVTDLDSLQAYLNSVTLDDLVKELRDKGITQKAFCESISMTSRHLSAVKSSELRKDGQQQPPSKRQLGLYRCQKKKKRTAFKRDLSIKRQISLNQNATDPLTNFRGPIQ